MNHWKVTAIGMAVVMATALVTGIVVANWPSPQKAVNAPSGSAPTTAPAPGSPAGLRHAAVAPSAADIAACNEYAQAQRSDRTAEVLKDVLIGGAVGAGVGAAGGAIAGGGKGAGKGAGIGGLVGATAGTLYGINEANKADARTTAAYQACLRTRGYVG